MKNRKRNQYYNAIMGSDKNSFKSCFERSWIQYLDSFPMKHKDAVQLRIGNRLRPCMVCWGYALSTTSIEEMNFEKIIDLAIGMELIHKGSIIIDDYIDDDFARRGQMTFHKEYSPNEAIMFLLFMLGRAIEQLAKYTDVEHISQLICSMSEGALMELGLSQNDFFEIKKINDIVKGETVALITDSLLLGYRFNKKSIPEMNDILERVAYKCAYNFQLLNDLEPFSAIERNVEYKQNHNFDFEKNRKNLIVSRLYQVSTQEDRNLIITHLKDESIFEVLLTLIEKYELRESVIREVENAKVEMIDELSGLESLVNNTECLKDFLLFIDNTIQLCYLRI